MRIDSSGSFIARILRTMQGQASGRPWHFVLLGSLLFFGSRFSGDDEERVIRVARTTREHLRLELEAELGRAPTTEESKQALQRWKLDEVVFREAKRLGILREDAGVRAWVAQRAKDVYRGLEIQSVPTQQELDLFLAKNRARYEAPERFELEQVFASREKGDAHARARRFKALADQGLGWLGQGDDLEAVAPSFEGAFEDIARQYGLGFATGVSQAAVGEVVVLESTWGVHAVRVKKRNPPALPPTDMLRPRLLRDFRSAEPAKGRADQRLVARYRFVEETP